MANNKDPFVPETVRMPLGDGTDAVDLGETALNHLEAPLPQIDSSLMRPGDVLTVEFEGDHTERFEIASIDHGSLMFASEDVTHPEAAMHRYEDGGQVDDEPIRLFGSAVSPGGMMRTPGKVRVGSYLMTDLGISTGIIRNFDLKRLDGAGELQPIALNINDALKPESESFSRAHQAFEELSALIEDDGYRFGVLTPDEILEDGTVMHGGTMANYTRVGDEVLLYAARQGFGSGVIPQDEIYTYDAEARTLRGIRNIPALGIMQTMVAEGVTKDIFQKAFVAYRDGVEPDWSYPLSLNSSGISRLSDYVPLVSYTWLNPGQEAPVITVLESGENISDMFATSRQKGAVFKENMTTHGGEDLIDRAYQDLGIDPEDSRPIYAKLELDIHPDRKLVVRKRNELLWDTDEEQRAFTDAVSEAASISYDANTATLEVDGHQVTIQTDPRQDIDEMVEVAKRAYQII